MNVKQKQSFRGNSRRRLISQRWNTGNKKWNYGIGTAVQSQNRFLFPAEREGGANGWL